MSLLSRVEQNYIARAEELVEALRIKRLPVDLLQLAELSGITRVVVVPRLDVSGRLVWTGSELVAQLNGREHPSRRSFTLCHEIAHTFADPMPTRVKYRAGAVDCDEDRTEEVLCDRAASELLFPRKIFLREARSCDPNVESLRHLATVFGASLSATILRLGQLGIWPVVFLIWRFISHPGQERRLRIAWSVKPDRWHCYVPRYASADQASGMYATFITAHPTFEVERLDLGGLRGRYLVENARFGNHVVSLVHDPKLRGRGRNAG
jgi:IrrE N-terminal-like domain